MSLLEVCDLEMVYPNGHQALKSITMSAEAGEIIAIIGRSGAGKSTLLRCINGLQRPTSGAVVLDGKNITAMHDAQLRLMRRRIGSVIARGATRAPGQPVATHQPCSGRRDDRPCSDVDLESGRYKCQPR